MGAVFQSIRHFLSVMHSGLVTDWWLLPVY